jgi:hypothetical protein
MRFVWLASILWSSLLLAGNPDQDINVNTRYTVESVDIAGDNPAAISTGLRGELTRLVGAKLNPAALDDLAKRIRQELHVRAVTHRLLRGQTPEHVRVVFDVRGTPAKFEASVPKLVYRSDGDFSGLAQGTATVGSQAFTFGGVSDDLRSCTVPLGLRELSRPVEPGHHGCVGPAGRGNRHVWYLPDPPEYRTAGDIRAFQRRSGGAQPHRGRQF